MKLSEIIREYRKEHKLSMDAMAERSGLSKAYIAILENERNPISGKPSKPSLETIQKLANAMGRTTDELISMMDADDLVSFVPQPEESFPEDFDTPEQAVLWMAGRPVLSFYGGGDISKMDPEDQLEFAKELLSYMKYLSSKKQQE